MSFLGMGLLEILVIFLIAFILVGPERMVDMGKKAGKLVRELRKMSAGLQESISMTEFDDMDLTGTRSLANPSRQPPAEVKSQVPDDEPVSFKTYGEAASGLSIAADAPGGGPESDRSDAAPEEDDPDEHESDPGMNGATR